MHVFGPPEQYPPAASRGYTPTPMLLGQYLAMAGALGLQRVVFVQPSAYGTDNSCMVDALRAHPGFSRGVAVIGAAVSDEDLRLMTELGVRAARLNLVSNGVPDLAGAEAMLMEAARRVGPRGWHIQIFADLPLLASLGPVLPRIGTPVVIDHMGHPRAASGLHQPGFDGLLQMFSDGLCWVKLSGANRVSAHPTDYADAAPFARALIAANPRRIVWGTDWPHIAPHPPATERAPVACALPGFGQCGAA